MFNRRRRTRPLTPVARPPRVPEALRDGAPATVDPAVVFRAARLRTALFQAGVDLERASGPAPAWFTSFAEHAGSRVLTPQEQSELSSHLAGFPADAVLTDAACERVVQRIGSLAALRELKSQGIDLYPCSRGGAGDLLDMPAASLRRLGDYVRQQLADIEAPDRTAPATRRA
ncbi:hypothetical protein [Streptomyces sp. NPDC059743]|uniref:hypothetical protein n=1 Tax=Streptomyces sp. NPDC059743 TaxID=3346928 RepID=UPI00365AD3DA